MGVSIEITGAESAIARLEELDSRLGADPRPLFENVAEEWASEFRRHFNEDQATWAPLSGTTIAERAKGGFGPTPILQRKSVLLNSITTKIEPNLLRVGTDHVAARLLNFGGRTSPRSRYPDRQVPARPFIYLRREAIEDTMEQIQAFYFGSESPLDA